MSSFVSLTPRFAGLYLTAINILIVAVLVGLDPQAMRDFARSVLPKDTLLNAPLSRSGRLTPIDELCPPCTRLVHRVIAFDRKITAEAGEMATALLSGPKHRDVASAD